MSITRRVGTWLERVVYVVAGLPIAIHGAAVAATSEARLTRRAFARRYWRPSSIREMSELAVGLMLAPIAVPIAAIWFTVRNGLAIRRREGKGLARQFFEQLQLYWAAGIVGPWYYILSLHRDGRYRAPTFLQRCEVKRGIYALLKSDNPSPLGNKRAFAECCAKAGVRCVACELVIDSGGPDPAALPDCDLFIKPMIGEGGKGAERWNRLAPRTWSNGTVMLGDEALLARLRSKMRPLIVQKLVKPHSALECLTSGAVPTVRALTVIDEQGRPELVATVFRMSMGENRTVDNIHAGGLACAVSLDDGSLGLASDLGSDARFGWHRRHPTTDAPIEGTRLPSWDETKALAIKAHTVFPDRLVIGWDIAIAEDGPIVIEGNRGPDVDLMQRFMELGFCHHHRFGQLIAHHLRVRGYGDAPVSAPDANLSKEARGAVGTSPR
jgi:hypothetical protein